MARSLATRKTLEQVERQARSRLRLITPENAGKVLSRDIYWTVPFLELFLEECDERGFEDPAQGYSLALHAPNLARIIGVGRRPGEYASQRQKISFETYALTVFAGMCRRVGRITDAEVHYGHAFRLCSENEVAVEVRAELERRYGIFLTTGQASGGEEHLERSIELSRSIDHPNGLAECLVDRGVAEYCRDTPPHGAVDFARALQLADPRTARGSRVFKAGLANLAYAMTLGEGSSLVEHARALETLQEVKKTFGSRRRSRNKVMVLVMEALLYKKLHFLRHAGRLMSRARSGLIALELPYELAQVSLELAIIYLEDGELELLEELRRDTLEHFSRMSEDEKLIEALGRWPGAVTSGAPLRRILRQDFCNW